MKALLSLIPPASVGLDPETIGRFEKADAALKTVQKKMEDLSQARAHEKFTELQAEAVAKRLLSEDNSEPMPAEVEVAMRFATERATLQLALRAAVDPLLADVERIAPLMAAALQEAAAAEQRRFDQWVREWGWTLSHRMPLEQRTPAGGVILLEPPNASPTSPVAEILRRIREGIVGDPVFKTPSVVEQWRRNWQQDATLPTPDQLLQSVTSLTLADLREYEREQEPSLITQAISGLRRLVQQPAG